MTTGIFGAGSIGCHVGGMLAAKGLHPVLVGRPAMAQRLASGMVMTSHEGRQVQAPPGSFTFDARANALAECECVLVCVKSGDTAQAGKILSKVTRPDALIVSLQNGVSNAKILREAMPGRRVLAAMVGFNVAQIGDNRFHRGTEGEIVIEDGEGALHLATALTMAGVPAMVRRDIEAVQWGKLLLNLNNAVNALSGLPLKRQLADRGWRKVLSVAMTEALAAMQAAGIVPARLGKVAPGLIPPILQLPDWLFKRIAGSMLRIDEDARSSMAEDLERGRPPEIDWLNGEIVRLGERHGVPTPVNATLTAMVHELFAQRPPVHPSAQQVLARLQS